MGRFLGCGRLISREYSPTNDERVKEETHGSVLRSDHKKIIILQKSVIRCSHEGRFL